ncbi:TPA: hypothetical protein ACFNMI_000706 [Neisseria bacilliformis]
MQTLHGRLRRGSGIGETARRARRLRGRIMFGQLAAQGVEVVERGGGIGFGVGVFRVFVGGGVAFEADEV